MVKSLDVVPLVWFTELTATKLPVVEKLGIKAVTEVPVGTVAVMEVPDIVAVTSLERAVFPAAIKLKAVIAFAVESATVTVTV